MFEKRPTGQATWAYILFMIIMFHVHKLSQMYKLLGHKPSSCFFTHWSRCLDFSGLQKTLAILLCLTDIKTTIILYIHCEHTSLPHRGSLLEIFNNIGRTAVFPLSLGLRLRNLYGLESRTKEASAEERVSTLKLTNTSSIQVLS